DDVFGEAAVGGEAAGAVALGDAAVVQARGVHAEDAVLATAAPFVDLARDAVPDAQLVDGLSQRHHRACPLVARGELAEGRLVGKRVRLDLEIGAAGPAHRDPHQDLARPGPG